MPRQRASRASWAKWLATGVAAALALSVMLAVPASAATRGAATKCADPSGTVKIGASYFGGVGQAYAGIGGSDAISPADQAVIDNYKAGVAALNAAGGLAGCQVELVTFNFSAQAPDYNQLSQQECAHFTQDNHVVAVYQTGFETKVAVDCYAKAKTPYFAGIGSYQPSCADLQKYAGYVYLPSGIAFCRYGAFVPLWQKAGLFPAGTKVGILAADDGSGAAQYLANKVYAPQLKKLKIPSETFTYHGATSSADFAVTNSTLAPAILKFKADGVNVVLFTPIGGQGPAAFMPQATNQGYFPAYGLTTADSLLVASALGGTAIKKGIAVSWAPSDLPVTTQQTLPTNPAITECAKWSAPNPAGVTGVSPYCDFLNLLQAGFKNASDTSAKTLAAGIKALGTTWDSSVTYDGATKLNSKVPGGGAYMTQMLKFDPASKSFTFISANDKAVPIP